MLSGADQSQESPSFARCSGYVHTRPHRLCSDQSTYCIHEDIEAAEEESEALTPEVPLPCPETAPTSASSLCPRLHDCPIPLTSTTELYILSWTTTYSSLPQSVALDAQNRRLHSVQHNSLRNTPSPYKRKTRKRVVIPHETVLTRKQKKVPSDVYSINNVVYTNQAGQLDTAAIRLEEKERRAIPVPSYTRITERYYVDVLVPHSVLLPASV